MTNIVYKFNILVTLIFVFSMFSTCAYGLPGGKAKLTGDYQDYGVDADGDGFYDFLTVDVGVYARTPAEYSLTGYLYDSNGQEAVWAMDHRTLSTGHHTMHLDFDGKTIEKHNENGPYRLKNLMLSSGSSDVGLELCDYSLESYNTSQYSCADFVDPLYTDKVITGNGSGELLLTLTVRDSVPVYSGRYSYDLVGINIPPLSTPFNVTCLPELRGRIYDLPGVIMAPKPNNFSVTAYDVCDLNIGLKKLQGDRTRIWVTTQIDADENNVATAESDLISPGPYHAKIFGRASENVSSVNLSMSVIKKIIVDGRFEMGINTTGFPAGNCFIKAEALNGSFSFDEIAIGGLAFDN